jgi:FKBP-type peptidyl-prolyl cis-trans isomerase (trigger factor)
LEIHVEPEIFEEGMQKSYLKNRKSISVPGFRKGKVPRKIIERFYGEAIFYEDAINEVVILIINSRKLRGEILGYRCYRYPFGNWSK